MSETGFMLLRRGILDVKNVTNKKLICISMIVVYLSWTSCFVVGFMSLLFADFGRLRVFALLCVDVAVVVCVVVVAPVIAVTAVIM